jgi:hypothetical protein
MMSPTGTGGDVENNFASPPPPEPMLSPDDESPGLDRGHSLPNVEELRVDHHQGSTELVVGEDGAPSRKSGRFVWLIALCLALLVIAVATGVSVALAQSNNDSRQPASASSQVESQTESQTVVENGKQEDNGEKETDTDVDDAPPPVQATSPPTTPATLPPDTDLGSRSDQILNWLTSQGISSAEALQTDGSAQQLALQFMTEDGLFLDAPTTDKSTPEGYNFMTRYVLSVLYYATKGDDWQFDLNFKKPTTHCAWYSVLQYVDLSTEFRGVACDQETGQVDSLFMSEFFLF